MNPGKAQLLRIYTDENAMTGDRRFFDVLVERVGGGAPEARRPGSTMDGAGASPGLRDQLDALVHAIDDLRVH